MVDESLQCRMSFYEPMGETCGCVKDGIRDFITTDDGVEGDGVWLRVCDAGRV